MSDKRTTLDDAVTVVESGMTIGIGGWGSRRTPMAFVRALLGSDVRAFWGEELQTVRSPYPTDGGYEELVAMPALNLDAAFVHLNLGDQQGNAAYTGIDPYFDDLFLMAAQNRLLSVETVVPTE